MKIRLLGQGYEKFDGLFGTTLFAGGVSVDHVSPIQARFFASLMSIEDADTGIDPGDNALFLASMDVPAFAPRMFTIAELMESGDYVEPVIVEAPVVVVKKDVFTQAQLEKVADDEGIAGLRKIADPFDIKSTSIAKLIEMILVAQSGNAPAAATLAEGQPDEVVAVEVDQEIPVEVVA